MSIAGGSKAAKQFNSQLTNAARGSLICWVVEPWPILAKLDSLRCAMLAMALMPQKFAFANR